MPTPTNAIQDISVTWNKGKSVEGVGHRLRMLMRLLLLLRLHFGGTLWSGHLIGFSSFFYFSLVFFVCLLYSKRGKRNLLVASFFMGSLLWQQMAIRRFRLLGCRFTFKMPPNRLSSGADGVCGPCTWQLKGRVAPKSRLPCWVLGRAGPGSIDVGHVARRKMKQTDMGQLALKVWEIMDGRTIYH